ncbi:MULTISPECIES: BREX-1 system adenine-specific DNA-methyltransferase PglX [Actinomyces]|uniref:site-specific DNA-methyltransferase (adenine-specific) n=1 Tax=Actinomyces respiraculi TaxID=2744574 RepID=A0A7T0PVN5_9ACTO|nr:MULTISPECIES: BREX-1 system adenine-specific DNA-methyltransferase PglX [Actinomyces]QPL04899.1 BREX-1 system adenine-specific DNA-methyltransferase PglX [Actinomyces respiraculi]
MSSTRRLESFAADARTRLITEVGARLSAVLAPASTARVDFPAAVKALEKRIRERGGGEEGRRHVIEEQAYIWFNRIIALRFMDANGYTVPALVSPDGDRAVGQPAVLAAAKRGDLDPEVFTGAGKRILDLLDGTVASPDAQGEAYGLILAAYCAHWNSTMPFMFAPAGDYTTLLMPADMLSQDSVRARAVEALTVQDCEDVEVIGWLYQFYISERKNEVFASFNKGRKAGADEIPAATQLFTPDWIVRYLVQNSVGRLWVLGHPEARLVEQMEYDVEPMGRAEDALRIGGPEELTVMDPCCGSGHMLTYAFDLLYDIYEEEGYAPSEIPGLILTHNLYGTEIDPRAAALAAFALMMKARSRHRGFLRRPVQPRIRVIDPVEFTAEELDRLAGGADAAPESRFFWQSFSHADVLGSLIRPEAEVLPAARQTLTRLDAEGTDLMDLMDSDLYDRARTVVEQAEYLARRYAVVVTNPPYMGSSNMGAQLKTWVGKHHPEAKADLFAAFIERCLTLAHGEHGMVAMITMQAWMFLGSFEKMRRTLLRDAPPTTMLHLGERAFDSIGGEVVSTTAFVLEPGRGVDDLGRYLRLVEGGSEAGKQDLLVRALAGDEALLFETTARTMLALPGARLAYWLSSAMTRAFTEGRPLGEIAAPKQGLATADNARFLRLWFEVSRDRSCFDAASRDAAKASGATWFPHLKGGEFRKWWGNQDYVVNWERDGEEIQDFRDAGGKQKSRPQNIDSYFKPAISWSLLTSGAPSFRVNPAGSISGHKGPIIPANGGVSNCGLLNSSTVESLLQVTSSGLGFEVGHVSEIPLVDVSSAAPATSVVDDLVELFRSDWNAYETSWDFTGSPLVQRMRPGDSLSEAMERWWQDSVSAAREAQLLETENNRYWAQVYGLEDEVPIEVTLSRVSLTSNPWFRYAKTSASTQEDYRRLFVVDAVKDLISYGVGCILGRYSLDEPGLVLADQGSTLDDYLRRVPQPSVVPDVDGVIPVTDGEWFEDDIVTRFRAFLAAAFGRERLEANVRYLEDVLGKSLRQYFLKDFYADHCKRYSNRPIYWMFSSRTDSAATFRALIYLHRYTPATLGTVLGDYLREYQAKLQAEASRLERAGSAADLKRADAHRRALTECEDYERDVLYPLVTQGVDITLDDGVLVNYLRFGRALQKVASIERKRADATTWTWPTHPLAPQGGTR